MGASAAHKGGQRGALSDRKLERVLTTSLHGLRKALVAVALALVTQRAQASHPPALPEPQRILVDAVDSERIAVGMRFGGYYVTRDGGSSWFLACQTAIGYEDSETYPGVLQADGSLAISTGYSGIAWSADGCGWAHWIAETPAFIADMRQLPDGSGLLALNSIGDGEGTLGELLISHDRGVSWQSYGTRLPRDVVPMSLAVSPNDASRLYVTAVGPLGSVLLRSDDAGNTWSRRSINADHTANLRLIGATSGSVEALFLVVDSYQHPSDPPPGDLVLWSADLGESFSILFQAANDLPAAALAQDGTLAFGGPNDGVWTLRIEAQTSPGPAENVSSLATRSLAWSQTRLYSSALEPDDPFSLAVSDDGGRTFVPVLKLCDVLAPSACGAQSEVGSLCTDALASDVPSDVDGRPNCTASPTSPEVPDAGTPEPAADPTEGAGIAVQGSMRCSLTDSPSRLGVTSRLGVRSRLGVSAWLLACAGLGLGAVRRASRQARDTE